MYSQLVQHRTESGRCIEIHNCEAAGSSGNYGTTGTTEVKRSNWEHRGCGDFWQIVMSRVIFGTLWDHKTEAETLA